jgi:hypothetical protein
MIDERVTDEALLLAARTDTDAFTQFYRRHAGTVLGYLVRRTRDPELGADLTAETFGCRTRARTPVGLRGRQRDVHDRHVEDDVQLGGADDPESEPPAIVMGSVIAPAGRGRSACWGR